MSSPLVPNAVERLGGDAGLHDEVFGEVLRLRLAAFFLPQANERLFVSAHNDARIRAANETAAIGFHARNCAEKFIESHSHGVSP